MSFIKDMFKKFDRGKNTSMDIKKIKVNGLFQESESIKDFNLALSLASFTDKGMTIQARSDTSKKLFPDTLLGFIVNYSAIFIQQVDGEHLFGPLPIPKSQVITADDGKEIPFEDWYMLVHVFRSKDESVQDQRITSQGSLVASLFLMIYPRKFETMITQSKGLIKQTLTEASGVTKNIDDFSEKVINQLEQSLINEVKTITIDTVSNDDITSQIQRHLENQLLTITEKIESIHSLANATFRFIDKAEKSNIGIVVVGPLFDIVTALQYNIPPIKDLRNIKWRVFQSESEIVKLTVGKVIFYFVTPDKLDYFSRETNFDKIEIIALHFGSDVLDSMKELYVLNRMAAVPNPVLKPILFSHGEAKSPRLHTLLSKESKEFVKKTHLKKKQYPKDEDASILSEISLFYDAIVNLLTEFNNEQQSGTVSKDKLISKTERKSLSNIFQKSFGEENND